MKHWICYMLVICFIVVFPCAFSEETVESDKGFLDSVGDFFGNTWDNVSEFAGNTASDIGEKASGAWQDVSQFTSEKWGKLSETASKTWADVSEAAGNAWYGAGETISGVWNDVTGVFEPKEEGSSDDDTSIPLAPTVAPDDQVYFLGTVVNTGKDNGYSGSKEIDEKDPHYNWTLGRFYMKGFSRVMPNQADGTPVFLKTVGDKVALNFELYQDIDHLNGQRKMTISEDMDGYDKYFKIDKEKNGFGRGALIVKHVNFQNNEKIPSVYTDFLAARKLGTTDTTVELFEEGDYEVALDYEINNPGLLNKPSYTNYRIYFKFSVRNGNCMVFPFDVVTHAELTNSAITENGFSLDLAKSRYLNIDVKKEMLSTAGDGLIEDTRFNGPAKDGAEYTDEGIYTITVSNLYTGSTTVKRIFVGSSEALQKYRLKGIAIED